MTNPNSEPLPKIEIPEPPWGRESDLALAQWCGEGWAKPRRQARVAMGKGRIAIALPNSPRALAVGAMGVASIAWALSHTVSPDAGAATLAAESIMLWSWAQGVGQAVGRAATDFARHVSADRAKALPALSRAARSLTLLLRHKIPTDGQIAEPLALLARYPVHVLDAKLQAKGVDNWAARAAAAANRAMAGANERATALKERQREWRVGQAVRAAELGGPTAMAERAYEDFSKIAMLLCRQQAIKLAEAALGDAGEARRFWEKTLDSEPSRAQALAANPEPHDKDDGPEELEKSFAVACSVEKASFRPRPGLPTLAELVDFCDRSLQGGQAFPCSEEQRLACEALCARAEAEAIQGAVGELSAASARPGRRSRL